MGQFNIQMYGLEKIKERLLDAYIKHNSQNISYTDEQITL